MKIMIDLNIMLDILQERYPHYNASASTVSKVLNKELSGFLPSHALTTIYYITSKYSGKRKAEEVTDWMLDKFEISPADKSAFIRARVLQIKDFEDGVVASLAEAAECDYIVTRNVSDFTGSSIKAVMPEDFLARNSSIAGF